MPELYVNHHSKVHQMDARVKVILTLVWVFSVSFLPFSAWLAFIAHESMIISILWLSRIGMGSIAKRSLLALPFALAALPLVFSGPAPHLPLLHLNDLQIFYSPSGAVRFTGIVLKSMLSIQVASLLAATTSFPNILQALRQLRFPELLIAIIGFMWRYLYLMRDEVTRMLRARTSRSAVIPGAHHGGGSLPWRAGVAGGMVGNLFLRSLERSDRVYQAMVSRGYNGELPPYPTTSLSKQDTAALVFGMSTLMLIGLLGVLSGV